MVHNIYKDMQDEDLEGRVKTLEKEVLRLKELVEKSLKSQPSSRPKDQVDPPDDCNEDTWYTDHGHGD